METEMTKERARMQELIETLNRASKAYYAGNTEIMSNFEYDALYDELVSLEKKTGIVLSGSPTVNVGFESVDYLPKERHEKPMLSLDKTKDREELRDWLGDAKGLLSWKLDGLTVVLTYENGTLVKALTRGNGIEGEVITANARTFENIPASIPFKGRLVLRGEAVIKYSDFNRINEQLEEEAAEAGKIEDVTYKNPRNLCSGSVRQLSSAVTARRHVNLFPFALVSAVNEDGTPVDFENSREKQFQFLTSQGFEVVQHFLVDKDTILDRIAWFEEAIKKNDVPSDGLVLLLEDIAYGESLGMTAKFPRNAIAFKWADETAETILRDVEWSASRTGLINPVAVFDPVQLEGTTVRRASVHNVSIVRQLKLGIGDTISVFKANMIIPQIAQNLTKSGTLEIPSTCPVCGAKTHIQKDNESEVLVCENPDCPAKAIKSFTNFVSRPAMNIDGLSEASLEKFLGRGFLHEFADIYHLSDYRDEIVEMDGFGAKSYENLISAIDASRHTTLRRVLTALGIPGIGSAGARLLCQHYQNSLAPMLAAGSEELSKIDGIGPVLAGNFTAYFRDEKKRASFERLMKELTIDTEDATVQTAAAGEGASPDPVAGKTFVITGSLNHFDNRDALKELIEDHGGKVSGSVSKKTAYLINNDLTSTSGKNKKAKELNIPIISEDDFLAMLGKEA